MRSSILFTSALAALAQTVAAVTGAAEGFAKGVTGGGSATPVYPKTTAELVSYLGTPRPASSCSTALLTSPAPRAPPPRRLRALGHRLGLPDLLNKNAWCDNYQPNAPKVSVTYDKAGILGITVKSNKSLIGVGNKGIIKGKGLRMVSGVSNIIIQNVHITTLNPKYVWGGDAITLDNTDLIWIDHVTTSLIGRQHLVLGNNASNRVTVSNSKFDGQTSWSATCDGYHYWGLYFTGSNDTSTPILTAPALLDDHLQEQLHLPHVRPLPKVAGNTLLHAVNNYWYDSTGHNFELDSGAKVLAEGNIFQNIKTPPVRRCRQALHPASASAGSACTQYLGRACQVNGFGSSGSFTGTDTSFLSYFAGKNIASATDYNTAKNVINTAGFGTI
ncbi:unnamed protein product [Parascedosporium putredinis]|uniref:pectin lyase n=1 Tax=Parascedosporium putredinis TaxID=1442378 RepID=A0A9P1MBP8_9PEZI|nr:unnamed protein product [Parascedosporium putredinis]CAI7995208.1 unnamed protein product [Parascedosporium putredinis]